VADDLSQSLAEIEQAFSTELAAAGTDPRAVDEVRVRYLGRKGRVTGLMKGLGRLEPDQRPAAGQSINRLKAEIQERIQRALPQSSGAPRRGNAPTSACPPAGPGRERCTP
jgi:phenylalanyl-tRNA synthetase alpha chain